MAVVRPPITGDNILDSWTNQITHAINNGSLQSVGGAVQGVSSSGGNVTPGDDGLHTATLYLFARSATNVAPTDIDEILTYTYTTTVMTDADANTDGFGSASNWFRTIPSESLGGFVWVIVVNVADTAATETIAADSWSAITQLSAPGDDGVSPILSTIETSDGTVFKNGAGTDKTLTAHIVIGDTIPSETDYNAYNYKWTYGGDTVCIDTNRNVLNADGNVPLVSSDGMVCSTGAPADSTVNTNSGVLRTIKVGAEDISSSIRLSVEVSNIPE